MRRLALTGMSLAMALGISAVAQTATHTTLTVETREVDGRTVATTHSSVLAADGSPVAGKVILVDSVQGRSQEIAGAALDSQGNAEIKLDSLAAGDHSLRAVFSGDTERAGSQSEVIVIHPRAITVPDFAVAIAPASLTVKQGSAGSLVLSVTPVAGFTGFLSLSCSGTGQTTVLPVGVTCSYSPANLQVTSANAVTSNLSIQTSTAGGTQAQNNGHVTGSKAPIAIAILLPGTVILLAVSRKRPKLRAFAILIMIGGISILGTTACSARYLYLHHGPGFGGTALGNYTITVTAQTSNGVTAAAHSTSVALTVN
jgi:hypothetical protein